MGWFRTLDKILITLFQMTRFYSKTLEWVLST